MRAIKAAYENSDVPIWVRISNDRQTVDSMRNPIRNPGSGRPGRPVILTKDSKRLEFKTVTAAAEFLEVEDSTVRRNIKNKRQFAGKYFAEYKGEK